MMVHVKALHLRFCTFCANFIALDWFIVVIIRPTTFYDIVLRHCHVVLEKSVLSNTKQYKFQYLETKELHLFNK